MQFCFFSRGSILETKNWLVKSVNRKLITLAEYNSLLLELQIIHKKLNGYIKVLRLNLSKQITNKETNRHLIKMKKF